MDMLPTLAFLGGANLSEQRVIDGINIWPLMMGELGVRSPSSPIVLLSDGITVGRPIRCVEVIFANRPAYGKP